MRFSCLTLISAFFLTTSAWAANYAEIHQGNVEVGGTADIYYNSSPGFVFNLNPALQYFVADRFSLGAVFDLYSNRDYTSFSIGPAAKYYFYEGQRWVSYVGGSFEFTQYSSGNGTNYEQLRAGVGMNYFFTPSVALGPSLNFSYLFYAGSSSSSSNLTTSILAGFFIYL